MSNIIVMPSAKKNDVRVFLNAVLLVGLLYTALLKWVSKYAVRAYTTPGSVV